MSVKLINDDCIKAMKKIPDNSIDMVLCDLPYGTTECKWDKVIDLTELWNDYKRVVKTNGAIVLFSGQPFTTDLIISNRRMFRYEWIWKKSSSTGYLNAKKMPLKNHENILVFYEKLPTYNPQWWYSKPYYRERFSTLSTVYHKSPPVKPSFSQDGRRYPLDVIEFKTVGAKNKTERYHPTQKPVELLEYLIETYTNEGETVLDNCMGSGSTGIACINTNRNFIGIELDGDYFNIAKQRIEQTENTILKRS